VSDGKTGDVELAGLFVYVGLAPATTWLDGALTLDAPDGSQLIDAYAHAAWFVCRRNGPFRIGRPRGVGRGDGAAAALSSSGI
jgi:alkyl hydroperoxide reductase subunit AhpF